ncbi:MAG: hypothetical protein M3Q44_03360 [bacterium]|nr:hypothetical protein [bacterium]
MIEIYKKKYETCLDALEQLRLDRPELQNETLSYNGILDPMAEGVLPILVGSDENKRRDEFTGSKKMYKVGVLIGISTDSSDLLGIVNTDKETHTIIDTQKTINTFLSGPRKFNQTVPMHSNRKVDGKRLWWWILNGVTIPKEKRPVNAVEIIDILYHSSSTLSIEELFKEVNLMEINIGQRFRLEKVIASWRTFLLGNHSEEFVILNFELYVTSGFYVRTFVEDISNRISIPMMVFSLKRTKVIFANPHTPSAVQ